MIEQRIKERAVFFGGWKLVRTIKARGDSAVFEIAREETGFSERCAMKAIAVLAEDVSENTDDSSWNHRKQRAAEAALEEVRIMIELQGRGHIIQYFDHEVYEWEDTCRRGCDLIIREELLIPLSDTTNHIGPLSCNELDILARHIGKALLSCHDAGIYHRDIKPSNIFRDAHGNYKLGDFGLAVRENSDPAPVYGTALYAAPELLTGRAEKFEQSADIYSFGLTLYELATGHLPFESSRFSSGNSIKKRLEGAKIPELPGVDKRLARIISTACSYERCERYNSAREMLLDIEGSFEQGKKPQPIEDRAKSKKGSYKKTVVTVSCLLALMILVSAFLLRKSIRARGAVLTDDVSLSEKTEEPALLPNTADPGFLDIHENATDTIDAVEATAVLLPTSEPTPVSPDEIAVFNNQSFKAYLQTTGQIGEMETYRGLNQKLSLHVYGFEMNDSGDLSDLSMFKNLETLEITNCASFDFQWLIGLKNLREIDIDDIGLMCTDAMPEFPELKICTIRNSGLSDIGFVEKMNNVEFFDVGYNNIRDIDGVQKLKHLKTFSIVGNRVRDLSVLSGSECIEILDVIENPVGEVGSLCGMTGLRELRCDSCGLVSIDLDEETLHNLEILSFSDNLVSDISVLQSALSLKRVFFENNAVSDVSVLFDLPLLITCWLEGNPVEEDQAEALERIVEKRNAEDETVFD